MIIVKRRLWQGKRLYEYQGVCNGVKYEGLFEKVDKHVHFDMFENPPIRVGED